MQSICVHTDVANSNASIPIHKKEKKKRKKRNRENILLTENEKNVNEIETELVLNRCERKKNVEKLQ